MVEYVVRCERSVATYAHLWRAKEAMQAMIGQHPDALVILYSTEPATPLLATYDPTRAVPYQEVSPS